MKEPSRPTYKRLFALSGNRCAFPGCDVPIIDAASGEVVGETCHIHAKRPGGARYDPRLSNQEVHAFENLILMCPTHHTIVDRDETSYSVERLRQIKAQHEAKYVNGQMPSDGVVEVLRRADKQLRVVELRRPPDAILELLKSKHIRRLSMTSKLMIAAAVFYLGWFGVDVWYMSNVGPNDWSALNMLPSPAFLLLTVGFSH